jgi:hypothetical protein
MKPGRRANAQGVFLTESEFAADFPVVSVALSGASHTIPRNDQLEVGGSTSGRYRYHCCGKSRTWRGKHFVSGKSERTVLNR